MRVEEVVMTIGGHSEIHQTLTGSKGLIPVQVTGVQIPDMCVNHLKVNLGHGLKPAVCLKMAETLGKEVSAEASQDRIWVEISLVSYMKKWKV